MTNAGFPLLVFQPVLGHTQDWTGVRIRGTDPVDSGVMARLVDEFDFASAIEGLACVLPADVIAQLDPAVLASGLVLQANADTPSVPPPPTFQARSGPTQSLLLRLLSQIACDAETRDIEATLKHDPQLSVQLLRLVNSVAFAPATRINSFAHAITLLGRRQLQRWLQLLLYASQAPGSLSNPLLARAALRAALMEGLCKAGGADRTTQDEAFMVGMFSLLEALFGQPLASIIEPLQLAKATNAALLQRAGMLGDLLTLVEIAPENLEAVAPALAKCRIRNDTWCREQIGALRWTLQVSREQH